MSITASLKTAIVTMMSGRIPSSIIHKPKDPLYMTQYQICLLYKTRKHWWGHRKFGASTIRKLIWS